MGRHTSPHEAADESDAAPAVVGTAPASDAATKVFDAAPGAFDAAPPAFDAAPPAFDAAPQVFDAAPQALNGAALAPAGTPVTAPTAAAPGRGVAAGLADETEVIPRVAPDPQAPARHQSIWPADDDYAPSQHTTPGYAATGSTAGYRRFQGTEAGDAGSADSGSTAAVPDGSGAQDASTHKHRRVWVWAGLAVFWVLALGAGLVTLASLGAPHYLCTGSAAKGLACRNTGTVLAAVLTAALVAVVGVVSVLSIEARAERRGAVRWLRIGVVALVVIAGCGYLLIRTIGG